MQPVEPDVAEMPLVDPHGHRRTAVRLLGSALNWQGQPQSQLQVLSSGPSMRQST